MKSIPESHRETLVFLTNEYFPKIGGAGTVVHEMAQSAVGMGWDVEVLVPGREELVAAPGARYRVTRLGHRGKQDWLARLSLLRRLSKRGTGNGERWIIAEPAALRALLYAHYFGFNLPKDLLVILHGSEILHFTAAPHRRYLLQRLLVASKGVYLLSHANERLLLERLPCLKARIIVAPGAPSRKPVTVGSVIKRAKPADCVDFLTVGRIHPRKGQLETLQALQKLPPESRSKVRYRIVGPCVRPRYLAKIRRLADQSDVPVEIVGSLSEEKLEAEYQNADVFIMTSRRQGHSVEGFGLTYLDAAVYGLPVIAYRTGGVEEAVQDGETGILVEEGNLEKLSAACHQLVQDAALRAKLGAKGTTFANAHSWEAATRALLSSSPSEIG